MAELTLEQRVATLEQEVAALKHKDEPPAVSGKWWEQVGPAFNNDPVFDEMLAYGRYFRATGCEPPANWKPGDPIPEAPSEDEAP